MPKAPIPDFMADCIYDLNPESLHGMGIRLLLLDLDNTLVPYGTDKAPIALRNWIDALKKAGIEPFILSNNRGHRPEHFARLLSIGFVGSAGKPSTAALRRVLAEKEVPREAAAIVGDQIYTDVLAGKSAGITTFAVRPLELSNPLLLLRYGLEFPFRALGRR